MLLATEAEYITIIEEIEEATWLKGLIVELRVSQGVTTVFLDSQSAIHLTKNDAIALRPSMSASSVITSDILLL